MPWLPSPRFQGGCLRQGEIEIALNLDGVFDVQKGWRVFADPLSCRNPHATTRPEGEETGADLCDLSLH